MSLKLETSAYGHNLALGATCNKHIGLLYDHLKNEPYVQLDFYAT